MWYLTVFVKYCIFRALTVCHKGSGRIQNRTEPSEFQWTWTWKDSFTCTIGYEQTYESPPGELPDWSWYPLCQLSWLDYEQWLNIVFIYFFFNFIYFYCVCHLPHLLLGEGRPYSLTRFLEVQTECLKLSFSGDNTIHKYPCYKVGLEFGSHDTAQDVFRPIPGLISSAGVTGRWGLLYHAQNGWPYSKVGGDSSKAPSLHAAVHMWAYAMDNT